MENILLLNITEHDLDEPSLVTKNNKQQKKTSSCESVATFLQCPMNVSF